jgi:hypothetical protein
VRGQPTSDSTRGAHAHLPATVASMAPPKPGDTHGGFFVQEDRCFRLVYSAQLQATHCSNPTAWRGRYTDARGTVHRVWACDGHAETLEGLCRAKGAR